MGRHRNWTELPEDLTSSILSRLCAVEIIETAQKVCTKWRKVSKDPLFWRRINMRIGDNDSKDLEYDSEAMFRHVVYRSSGNVVDINVEHFGNDLVLNFIAKSASTIRRLRLYSCVAISDYGLIRLAVELPLLEELEISLCGEISDEAVRAVGLSCPLLKSFRSNKEWCGPPEEEYDSDEEYEFSNETDDDADVVLAIAETMQGLRHLQLYGNKIKDDGLKKILESCPCLESLDLRHCFNLKMDGNLDMRCAEQVKRVWLPHDSTEGKGFSARSDGYCFKWTELPENITLSILSRLGAVDILESAQKVCMKWRKICKDPLMWHTIDMQNTDDPDLPYDLDKMCRHAIDRSCGYLTDINVEHFPTDDLLKYITDSSFIGIRRLRLVGSCGISDEGLIDIAPKLPLLENLDITLCKNLSQKPLEVLGHSCLLLKSFKLIRKWVKMPDLFSEEIILGEAPYSKDDDALAIAGSMHGLHHLQLIGNQLTNDGLRALLDGCPHLESLDLRCCYNLNLDGDLRKRCTEQMKKLLLPRDSATAYEFAPSDD